MKMMLLTSAIAISLGATSALAGAPEFSGIATERTSAIAETRTTVQKWVTKNGITCLQTRNYVTCIRTP